MRFHLTRTPLLVVLLLASPVLPGCATDEASCGTTSPGGGPAIIETREQEMCEVARRRLIVHLRKVTDVDQSDIDRWQSATSRWTGLTRIDALRTALTADFDATLAASIVQGIEQVRDRSMHPLAATGDPEAALVQAAAKGLKILVDQLRFDDPSRDVQNALNADTSEFPDELTD